MPSGCTSCTTRLTNIAAEMAIVMMKTSYSTIFNEGLDFSTMLLDRERQPDRREEFRPVDDGRGQLHAALDARGAGEDFFQPGDVVVHNDPYRGNCHIPEHMLMKPIFLGEELIGFAGASAIWRRSAARRPAASPRTPPMSIRRDCACRR